MQSNLCRVVTGVVGVIKILSLLSSKLFYMFCKKKKKQLVSFLSSNVDIYDNPLQTSSVYVKKKSYLKFFSVFFFFNFVFNFLLYYT